MKKFILCLACLSLLGCREKGEQEEMAHLELPLQETREPEVKPEKEEDETALEAREEPPAEEEDPLTAIVDGYQSITWWDLLSLAEWDYFQEISLAFEKDPSFIPGEDPPAVAVNPAVDGQKVRIPGFVVGVDTDPENFTKVKAFLFVPFQGACIHVPPPPTNQTIFASLDEAVGSNPYTAYWLYGIISVEQGNNDIAAYSYTFAGDKLEPYQPAY